MSRADYLRHLNTISAYRMLPGPEREAIFAELDRLLPDDIPVKADLTLHLARRI
ncbi:hypothetical protein [Microlunatus endophyticus]